MLQIITEKCKWANFYEKRNDLALTISKIKSLKYSPSPLINVEVREKTKLVLQNIGNEMNQNVIEAIKKVLESIGLAFDEYSVLIQEQISDEDIMMFKNFIKIFCDLKKNLVEKKLSYGTSYPFSTTEKIQKKIEEKIKNLLSHINILNYYINLLPSISDTYIQETDKDFINYHSSYNDFLHDSSLLLQNVKDGQKNIKDIIKSANQSIKINAETNLKNIRDSIEIIHNINEEELLNAQNWILLNKKFANIGFNGLNKLTQYVQDSNNRQILKYINKQYKIDTFKNGIKEMIDNNDDIILQTRHALEQFSHFYNINSHQNL